MSSNVAEHPEGTSNGPLLVTSCGEPNVRISEMRPQDLLVRYIYVSEIGTDLEHSALVLAEGCTSRGPRGI